MGASNGPGKAALFCARTWKALAIVALCIGVGLAVDQVSGLAIGNAPAPAPPEAQIAAGQAIARLQTRHFPSQVPAWTTLPVGQVTPFSYSAGSDAASQPLSGNGLVSASQRH